MARAAASSVGEQLPDLGALSTRGLLRLYAAILTELLQRRVVRSRNAPAGDLAELLVQKAYGGELAPASEKSWDVRAADGRLLQVKCRVVAGSKAQTYSPFRSWDFDACVFVVLDAISYDVLYATEVPVEVIRASAQASHWVAGSRVTVSMVRQLNGLDVTHRLLAAHEALDADRH